MEKIHIRNFQKIVKTSSKILDERELKKKTKTEVIVFFDLVGSTSLKLKKGHEEGTKILRFHNSICTAFIEEFHGMIVKELAIDLAPHRIRVNGIAPGWVAENEQGLALIHRYVPLHNCSINPRYIGRAAVYLASDYFSEFTTGTVLKIDAGLSLYNHYVDRTIGK